MKKKLFENVGGNSFKLNRITEAIEEATNTIKRDNLNLEFNFVVGNQNISYGTDNINWFRGTINKLYYSRDRDHLEFQGDYEVKMDGKNKNGEFAYSIKNFLNKGRVATAQTTGDGILRGFWQNSDIYAVIPNTEQGAEKLAPMGNVIFITSNSLNLLSDLRDEFKSEK